MLNIKKLKLKHIDSIDPERTIAKLCLRTAISCFVSMAVFQSLGSPDLSAWAGFAAFAFVQNDTQNISIRRYINLAALILFFTLLTFVGALISPSAIAFIISIPFVVFFIAYAACLGNNYFNAGAWALFLYLLAGSTPVSAAYAMQIMVSFLIAGFISLIVCYLVLPLSAAKSFKGNLIVILKKLGLLLTCNNPSTFAMLNNQIETLFINQDTYLSKLLANQARSKRSKEAYISISYATYPLYMLIKQVADFAIDDVKMLECKKILAVAVKDVLIQVQKGWLSSNYPEQYERLLTYRDYLTDLRKKELTNTPPDFSIISNYSNYFYLFIKAFDLLDKASKTIFILGQCDDVENTEK